MKPILFNTEMVQAIVAGRKTQTRRVVPLRIVYQFDWSKGMSDAMFVEQATGDVYDACYPAPYKVGEMLYVRETWYYETHMHDQTKGEPDLPSGRYSHRYVYRASSPDYPVNVGVGAQGWKPSIHMPKEAARIFLKVTNVRCERLCDIIEQDAIAEGFISTPRHSARANFFILWHRLNGRRDGGAYSYDKSPYVWVYTFERIEGGLT